MRYRAGELAADRLIHLTGTLAGVVGSAIMLGIAADVADRSTFLASLIYSVCLLTMLGGSAAYNLASIAPRRRLLRRFDHAAIFLMIAGTYTPFTTCRLDGVWAIGMTAAVWIGHAQLGGRSDRAFDRSWRRALFYRDRLSPLAGAAFPQRNLAQLRGGRGQLSLRSYSAWRGVGPIVSAPSTDGNRGHPSGLSIGASATRMARWQSGRWHHRSRSDIELGAAQQ